MSNYVKIFQDAALYEAILHSLALIVFFSVIPIGVGLLMTALLMGKVRRGMTFFRIVFFLPQVLPLVAVGITWRWLYSENGAVNQLLDAIGLASVTRAWLGDYGLALIALGLIGTWVMSGLCMMLFLAGAQKIDPSLYEAARLDGAGALRQFRHVTVPGVRREITVAACDHHDRRPGQLRPRLRHHQRRPGGTDQRARPARLPAGLQRGRHRRRQRPGGRADRHRDRGRLRRPVLHQG